MSTLPALPVAIPLVTAALLSALQRAIRSRVALWIAVCAVLGTLGCCIELFRATNAGEVVYWFGGWQPRHGIALGISFAADPIGAALAVLASVLVVAALLFSSEYFDTTGNMYHVLMLIFLGAMCGFALTGDLFNLFVFFELMSVTAYALCGYKTEDPAPMQGAFNFAVTNTVGAYFLLIGIALLYARTGALNMAQIGRSLDQHPADALVVAAFVLVACGFLVKAAVVPFHFWLADAHAVAPTPVCILFSGVMVELGLYAVARVYWTIFSGSLEHASAALRAIFAGIGVLTALGGAGMCFAQRNLKRLLALSTISHMGVMMIAVGLLNPEALAGAAVYLLSHAGAKAGLFACAGIILHRCESVDEEKLRGRVAPLTFTIAAFACGAVALAAPPFSGLAAGAALIHKGAESVHYTWIAWIVVAAGLVTCAATLRFLIWTTLGIGADRTGSAHQGEIKEKPETKGGHGRTPVLMWIVALGLSTAGLFMGIAPHLQSGALSAAIRFEDRQAYASRVLEGTPFVIPAAHFDRAFDSPHGLIALFAGIALALCYLQWNPGRRSLDVLGSWLGKVRDIHSGHVADYVAWLTFGVALFGLLGLVFLRAG